MLDMLPGGRYGKEFLELQEAIDLNYRYEVDVAATKKIWNPYAQNNKIIYKKDKNGNRIENKKEDYYEEYVGKLVEFIKDGKIKSSPNLGSRIGKAFYPVLKKTFPKLYKFDINQSNSAKAGKDMMKFVQWLGTMGPTKNVLDVGTGGRGSSGNNIQTSRDINSQISKLKKGSEPIVESNNILHDALVLRAQEKFGDNWKKILDSNTKENKIKQKEFVEETSDLRNAIAKNNENVAHWMSSHPKYGGKGQYSGITGDILVGKEKFFEKFQMELYELSRSYNPAKSNSPGAYMFDLIKKRYPGIMDQLAPETRTRSLTTEEGKVIDVKDISNYERFEDLNILEIELKKSNKAKLTEEANTQILQSKLRKEIGIETDVQKEKIFDQVKKDLQITKSPIGATTKSFLTSLKKVTENSHYDVLDKSLTTEKMIELKDVILESIPISELVQMGKFLPQGNIFVKTHSHPTKTKWGAEVEVKEFMGIRPEGGFKFNKSGKNLLPEMKNLFDVFSKMPQAQQKASPEYKEFKKKLKVGLPKIYERLDVGLNEWKAFVEGTTKGKRQTADKSGTKGNNRTSVIKKLSTSLTKDAIPELLETNKDFVDRYMDVKGLKEQVEAKALVEKFINDIGRQQGLQFSKNIQFGANEKQRLWDIIETTMGDFHRVFDVKVLEKNKAHLALTKDYKDKLSVAEADMILDLFLKNKINDIGYVLEKINQKIKPGDTRNKGAGEQWGINRMFKIRELTGMEIDFIREQTEVGDAADIQGKILEGYKGQPGISFNIEYKLSAQGSQYGSISGSMKKIGNKYTISTVNARTGINKLDAYSKENREKIEQLLKDVIPGHKIMVKKLNDLGKMDLDWTKEERQSLLDYKNIGDLYPNRVHTDFILKKGVNGKSILNGLETIGKFTETILEDHYINEKLFLGKEPSRHIILGDALYHIGQNVLGTNTTKIAGTFLGGFRGFKASQYKTVKGVKSKTGLVSLSLRFHPFKPVITSKPKARITTDLDLQKIFTKEGYEALKAKQAAKAQGQASKNIKNVIDYANGKKKAQGGSVFDFDHTVAVTKSGVKARVPNTDGKPKPKRKVIFLAGGAGSGKGNVIKKLNLEKDGFKIVNQDISLEWLKKNHGLPENMRDLTSEQRSTLGKLSHQARQIAKNKMMKYKGNADGVVVDGTGGSVKVMEKLIKEFKDKGYDTSMLFVETSLDVALARNRARKERSLLDKIVERNHEAVQKNKSPFKEMFGEGFMEVKTDKLTMESPMPKELVTKMSEFVRGYENMRLDAEQFASQGEAIKKKGGEFDFSEFNKVVDGKPGPFLEKLRERINEYGNKDVFILTARPAQSAFAIKEFLKEQGIEIPIENITGLANSTGAAKAKWMLEKYAEGYNDLYFVDDALQNVKAVKKVLEKLDIKSKVVQAKLKFSKDINKTFNEIIERKSKGKFKADREMSLAEARALGKSKGRFDFFVPPSAEDMKGLMYKLLGKGEQGNKDMRFFKKALFDPFARGTRDLTIVKQKMSSEYKELKKKSKNIKLNKIVEGTPYTVDAAVRMYLWAKAGYEVPGISKAEQLRLVGYVKSRPDLVSFAETLSSISRVKEGYEKPGEYWMVETIGSDLNNITQNRARKDFLYEWIENKNIIFSPENLNKIEATFGKSYREALENMLTRMELGTNRLHGIKDGPTKWWYDWVNGSVGATMFWNTRSALLQTISMANFTNHADNNIFIQARNFANQKQFWADFAMLYNSPMLKQRRAGLEIDVSASEIQNMFQKSGRNPKALLRYMLEKGFTPTRMADSFAIAMGGASFYRQKFKKYKKQGLSDAKAKEKAMLEFQEVAEETQQSSRPDLISQQQAGPLGRLILAWQNTPMQMTRLMKKSLSDVVNRRKIEGQSQIQSDMSNISRIIYYGAIQNLWFGALQSGLMWMLFGSDQDENMEKKEKSILNGAFDTLLRGTGIYGAAIATGKNVFMKYKEEEDNPFWKQDFGNVAVEAINLSPPLGSKVRKVYSAIKGWGKYNAAEIGDEMGLRADNPELMNIANIVEATLNIPLARLLNKSTNLEEAITGNHEWWQRVAMAAGWSRWNVGVKDEEVEAAKKAIEERKKEEKKEEKRKEKEEEKIKEEEEKKKKGIKTVQCSGIRSNGSRCGNTTETADKTWKCYHHAKFTDGMDRDGDGVKEYRCTATKKNGERCKNKTENTNKKCYAHQ
jgi:predicted kinase